MKPLVDGVGEQAVPHIAVVSFDMPSRPDRYSYEASRPVTENACLRWITTVRQYRSDQNTSGCALLPHKLAVELPPFSIGDPTCHVTEQGYHRTTAPFSIIDPTALPRGCVSLPHKFTVE